MKTLYLSGALAALLLAPFFADAQSGSVGIGTATPDASAVLDLSAGSKGLLIPRLDSVARVAIASPATGLLVFQTGPRPGFYYYGGSAWLFLPDKARGGDNLGNHTVTRNLDLGAHQLVGSGGTTGLAVSSGGNVGIGTAAPAAPLHVVGSSYQTALLESVAAGPHLTLRKPGAGEAVIDYIGADSGDGRAGALELRGNSSVQLSGDGNPASPDLTVTAAGRVGVGTTAPAAPLEVQAGTVLTGSNTGTETELRLARPGTAGSKWSASAELALGTYAPGANAQSQLDFRLGNGNSNAADQTVLTLRGDNRVGIGTADPASQLANTASNIVGTDGLGVTGSSLSWLSSSQGYAAAIQSQWSAYGGNGLAIKVADAGGNSTALDVSQGSSSTAGTSLLRVRSDGNVGIGVAVPAARLDVAGSVRLRGLTTAGVVTTDASGTLGSVAASTLADNLGNHTATQPLNLQGQALVGSGANIGSAIGVGVRADGGLNIGQNTPGGNVLLGYLAGASITTGSSNMFVGYRAGNSNTTGINNLFSGYKSGYSNTTGRNNQFTGFYSGYSNTTGNFNYFSGYLSGDDNTTGDNNQFIGYNSGPLNTTGSNNVFIGYQSGYSNTTASNNQFVGYRSGVFNTTGENNHFNGNFAGYSNTTGENNYFSGYRAGNSNRTGNNNYFSGYDSGYYNTTGSNNQFSGYRSGNSNTTGSNNLFSGYNSGSINTTGSNNWAFGYAAGPSTDGLTNAGALGFRAQVSQSNSLVLGGTGADAVRVGIGTKAPAAPLEVQAGTALTSSSIGTETELRLTRPGTGTKWDASADLALGTYATGINAQSQLNFRLGNDNTNTPDRTVLVLRGDGRVGIGTLTPTALLDVGGNAQVSGTLTAAAGVLTGLLTVSGTSNLGSLTVGGTSTLAGKVTAASVTTPDNSGANMLAAGYGNVFGAGTLANASGNVTVSRPGTTGEYLLTFSGPLATADFGSTALSLTLFNGPGFVSYTSGGSAGRLLVRTYNVGGTLTDRGFSFVVFQP